MSSRIYCDYCVAEIKETDLYMRLTIGARRGKGTVAVEVSAGDICAHCVGIRGQALLTIGWDRIEKCAPTTTTEPSLSTGRKRRRTPASKS